MQSDTNTEKLKQEIKDELSIEIERQIEEEVEEEISEEIQQHIQAKLAIGRFRNGIITVAATVIALGQFSEAVTLIEDGVNWARSKVTHSVEYTLLEQIHVGNTKAYIEELIGSPQISRTIEEGLTANYFHDEKFLLTIFFSESRVSGFTITPLQEDFTPQIKGKDESIWELQNFNYADFPANPQMYLIDHSKTASYYIESLDTGRAGLFFKTYLGNVSLRNDEPLTELIDLYQKDVYASDQEVAEAQSSLRVSAQPNFYGLGTLSLEQIQKSMLTSAEFSNYFGH